jgi:hypothetical protein
MVAKISAFFTQTSSKFLHQNIVLGEKRHFCRKLAKIAENCDHNIDARCDDDV